MCYSINELKFTSISRAECVNMHNNFAVYLAKCHNGNVGLRRMAPCDPLLA